MSGQSLLLDTHVWIWLLAGDAEKLGSDALSRIESALRQRAVAISVISLWEVATKAAKGRLELPPNTDAWLKRAERAPGIGIVQLDRKTLLDSTRLELPHGDPADRILVATAIEYDLQLVTADSGLLDYAGTRRSPSILDARA